jgi:hypothetical protein
MIDRPSADPAPTPQPQRRRYNQPVKERLC